MDRLQREKAKRLTAEQKIQRYLNQRKCGKKVKYQTYEDADRNMRQNPRLNHDNLIVYKCILCSGFHLGHP